MIKNIRLKFGKGAGSPAETISMYPVTVFVGPNNSGKSKALSEIHRFCTSGQKSSTDVIVDEIVFDVFSETIANEKIEHVTLKPHASESVKPENIIVGKQGKRQHINRQILLDSLKKANAKSTIFCQFYLQYNTLILDGRSRISLINQQSFGDLQQPPQTSFQALFRDDSQRATVRRIIHDAFGSYFTIDPTNSGYLRLRLSSREPTSNLEERGLHNEAVQFHSAALPIDQASDGVKAFTGIITEIIAGDPAVLLIDEPEAFLHPSLAFKLGNEIAISSTGLDKRIFVSTHSPNFLIGCIQSGAPINIVRLTYGNRIATARVLPNEDILKLMRNPLLRSTGVISGLFYEFVVVTEADTDRAFYQEINERLLRYMPELGIPNCLFINAQNKQTVQTIIRPLRELGIPAAGIVDIDILKEGGSVWSSFLGSAFVPEIECDSLSTVRSAVKKRFDQSDKNMKRQGGIELLNTNDKESAKNLLERLAEYGLFVIPHGELESWLKNLGATGHGPAWLINIFEKMGEDPEIQNYVKPSGDDVWEFLGQVKTWLVNPKRKGIPT